MQDIPKPFPYWFLCNIKRILATTSSRVSLGGCTVFVHTTQLFPLRYILLPGIARSNRLARAKRQQNLYPLPIPASNDGTVKHRFMAISSVTSAFLSSYQDSTTTEPTMVNGDAGTFAAKSAAACVQANLVLVELSAM
jgi:hypothetical protein